MSPTTSTAVGLVCSVGHGHPRKRPFRRGAYRKHYSHFIRFNNTRRPIERTGLARCANNETYTAGAKAGTADPV